MSISTRKIVLRANALYLFFASIGGLRMDVLGSFFATGPSAGVLEKVPDAGIGFLEAHGLALILSILFWLSPPQRSLHFTAAAVHTLLGTANLLFWQLFIAVGMLWMGYLTTALHGVFAVLQFLAAISIRPNAAVEASVPKPDNGKAAAARAV